MFPKIKNKLEFLFLKEDRGSGKEEHFFMNIIPESTNRQMTTIFSLILI